MSDFTIIFSLFTFTFLGIVLGGLTTIIIMCNKEGKREEDNSEKEKGMYCPHCGKNTIVWTGDQDIGDITMGEETGVINEYICYNCGAELSCTWREDDE